MKKYMDELYARLEELAGKPLTLGRIEEADAVADLLCRLHKLDGMDGDHFRESTKMTEFSREDAMRWAEHMQNADGTVGPHWTMDQTSAVADASGIPHDIPPLGVGCDHEHDVLGLLRCGAEVRSQRAGVLRGAGAGILDGQGRSRPGGKALCVLQVHCEAKPLAFFVSILC